MTGFIITAFIFSFVLKEAINGKQKKFARLGVGILFINMVLVNLEILNSQVSNFIVYCGLAIIVLMILVRCSYLLKTKAN